MTLAPGNGWEQTLAEYEKVAKAFHAGRTPREELDGLTAGDLGNEFLTAKTRSLEV